MVGSQTTSQTASDKKFTKVEFDMHLSILLVQVSVWISDVQSDGCLTELLTWTSILCISAFLSLAILVWKKASVLSPHRGHHGGGLRVTCAANSFPFGM